MIKTLLKLNDDFIISKYNATNSEVELVKLMDINLFSGVGKYQCPECEGTGVFWITDTDSQNCITCKTSGWLNVVLF